MPVEVSMNSQEFVLNPAQYGIPDYRQLKDLRIWDSHYHGLLASRNPVEQHKEMMYYVERMGIERVISLDIGGTHKNPFDPQPHDRELRVILERDKAMVSGIIPIDPGFPEESRSKMKDWI